MKFRNLVKSKKHAPLLLALLALTLLGGTFAVRTAAGQDLEAGEGPFSGTVECREVSVRAKVPGYISRIDIVEGQEVEAGDSLFSTNPEDLLVKQQQAQGTRDAAKAMYDKALHGATANQIKALKAVAEKAALNVAMLQEDYDKTVQLYEGGALSDSEMNKLTTQLAAAKLDTEAANAQYRIAADGARVEEIAAAKGQWEASEGVLAEVELNLEATAVEAPVRGTVTLISSDVGELIGSGTPIVTLTDYADSWVIVNVDESTISKLQLCQSAAVSSKTDPGLILHGTVSNISKNPDFATKKSTNELNDFDLISYQVKIQLPQDTALFPGMQVTVSFEGRKKP